MLNTEIKESLLIAYKKMNLSSILEVIIHMNWKIINMKVIF